MERKLVKNKWKFLWGELPQEKGWFCCRFRLGCRGGNAAVLFSTWVSTECECVQGQRTLEEATLEHLCVHWDGVKDQELSAQPFHRCELIEIIQPCTCCSIKMHLFQAETEGRFTGLRLTVIPSAKWKVSALGTETNCMGTRLGKSHWRVVPVSHTESDTYSPLTSHRAAAASVWLKQSAGTVTLTPFEH